MSVSCIISYDLFMICEFHEKDAIINMEYGHCEIFRECP